MLHLFICIIAYTYHITKAIYKESFDNLISL